MRLLHHPANARPAPQPLDRFGGQRDSELAQDGVKEINLIAQDLTAYGRDRKDGTTPYDVCCAEWIKFHELEWIRLLYTLS